MGSCTRSGSGLCLSDALPQKTPGRQETSESRLEASRRPPEPEFPGRDS